MENDTRARYIRRTALCIGLAAGIGLYTCGGKATELKPAYSQHADRWAGISPETRYSMVEEALIKMPVKDLYRVGSKVFTTRFNGTLEGDVLSAMKQYAGERK